MEPLSEGSPKDRGGTTFHWFPEKDHQPFEFVKPEASTKTYHFTQGPLNLVLMVQQAGS